MRVALLFAAVVLTCAQEYGGGGSPHGGGPQGGSHGGGGGYAGRSGGGGPPGGPYNGGVEYSDSSGSTNPSSGPRGSGGQQGGGGGYYQPAATSDSAGRAQESSGFVQPIDFSSFFRDSGFGGIGSSSNNNFQIADIFKPSSTEAKSLLSPSTRTGPAFGELESSSTENNYTGFVAPNLQFRSLFDGYDSGKENGFRAEDFLKAFASEESNAQASKTVAPYTPSPSSNKPTSYNGGPPSYNGGPPSYSGGPPSGPPSYNGGPPSGPPSYNGGSPSGPPSYKGKPDYNSRGGSDYVNRPGPNYDRQTAPAPSNIGPSSSAPAPFRAPSHHRQSVSNSQSSYNGRPTNYPEYRTSQTRPENVYQKAPSSSSSPHTQVLYASATHNDEQKQPSSTKCRAVEKKVGSDAKGNGGTPMVCEVCEDPALGGAFEKCSYGGGQPAETGYFVAHEESYSSKGGKAPGTTGYRYRRSTDSLLHDVDTVGSESSSDFEDSYRPHRRVVRQSDGYGGFGFPFFSSPSGGFNNFDYGPSGYGGGDFGGGFSGQGSDNYNYHLPAPSYGGNELQRMLSGFASPSHFQGGGSGGSGSGGGGGGGGGNGHGNGNGNGNGGIGFTGRGSTSNNGGSYSNSNSVSNNGPLGPSAGGPTSGGYGHGGGGQGGGGHGGGGHGGGGHGGGGHGGGGGKAASGTTRNEQVSGPNFNYSPAISGYGPPPPPSNPGYAPPPVNLQKSVSEFNKKDRSNCKKTNKDKMTCYVCIDKNGMQHEECMYAMEMDPKTHNVAYHESKEYRYDPPGGKESGSAPASASSPSINSGTSSAPNPNPPSTYTPTYKPVTNAPTSSFYSISNPPTSYFSHNNIPAKAESSSSASESPSKVTENTEKPSAFFSFSQGPPKSFFSNPLAPKVEGSESSAKDSVDSFFSKIPTGPPSTFFPKDLNLGINKDKKGSSDKSASSSEVSVKHPSPSRSSLITSHSTQPKHYTRPSSTTSSKTSTSVPSSRNRGSSNRKAHEPKDVVVHSETKTTPDGNSKEEIETFSSNINIENTDGKVPEFMKVSPYEKEFNKFVTKKN